LPSFSRQTRQERQAGGGRHQAGKPGKEATSEWRGRQANEQKDVWMAWWIDVWMAWWIDEWRE